MTVTRAVVVVAAFTTSLDGAVGGPSVMLRLSTLRVCARARPDQMDSVGSATSLREESSDSVARSEL